MIRLKQLLPGSLTTLLVTTAMTAQAAPNEGTCLQRLTWSGDTSIISHVRAALSVGPLARAAARSCEGATVHIVRQDDSWRFQLTHHGRTVSHTARSVGVTSSWLESWLAPGLAPVPAKDREAPPEVVHSSTAREGPRIPIQAAARALVDLDALGPAWPGFEIAFTLRLWRSVWIGTAAAGAWAPEDKGVSRRNLRMTARGGWLLPLSWGALRLGAGLGIVAASAQYTTSGGAAAATSEATPLFEGLAMLEVDIARNWALTLGALARVHIPTEGGSESKGEHPNNDEVTATAPVSATILAGVAWHNGWLR